MILSRLITAVVAVPGRSLRARRLRALLERAESLRNAGELSLAEARYREALALDPAGAAAHASLALLLTGRGRPDEALAHFRSAGAAAMGDPGFLEAFVRMLIQRGEHSEALSVAREAAQTHGESYEAAFCLGLAHQASHDYAGARAHYDDALELRPDAADAHANRGIALQGLGLLEEACADYERALSIEPAHPLARFHRSLALLLRGDYGVAWPEYETRFHSANVPLRPSRYPPWDGTAAAGRMLLVYGEQGLGDEIMFASCLPELMRTGARCVIECNPALHRLFTRSFDKAVVYPATPDRRVPDDIHALGVDAEVPIGSLPLRYRRSVADFPQHSGYLRADPDRVAAWRERLAALGDGIKVGISWRGGTQASRAPLRSIMLEEWLPVLQVPGVRFVSLQYTANTPQDLEALQHHHGVGVAHWPEAIGDYDETAALVSALDLTVSVCTSVVHLAGALGQPVWVLAPRNPEWRYGCSGGSMPWYPSARIFRQKRDRDWSGVLGAVQASLTMLAKSGT